MAKKIKRIVMPPKSGICREMAKIFQVSPQSVSNALAMKTNGGKAPKIRLYALEHGGHVIR